MTPTAPTRTALAAVLCALLTGPVVAQPLPQQVPDGAVLPQNLNALGGMMADRVGELLREGGGEEGPAGATGRQLDLFSGSEGEDPNLAEIRRIARGLETQRSLMLKLAELQSDLIEFGTRDPHAAFRSRVPSEVCELAMAAEFCENLTASFR